MTRLLPPRRTALTLISASAMCVVAVGCGSSAITNTSSQPTSFTDASSTTGAPSSLPQPSSTSAGSTTISGATTEPTIAPYTTSPSGVSSVSTSTAPPKSNVSQVALALTALEQIIQTNEFSTGYSRDLFRHWIDADRNSCNTREEVLIQESVSNAQVDRFGCKVIAGDWFSPFDGLSHTDPSNLDIDHLVPLKEAWDSGAHSWSSEMREAFANDLSDGRSLIAVTNSVNRSKGDRDPSQWLPPRSEYVCQYVSDWIAVKVQWKLSMDQSEWGRLKNLLSGQCGGQSIAPWGSVD